MSRVFDPLLARFPDLAALTTVDAAEIENYLVRIGLQMKRVRELVALAACVTARHDGVIPKTKEELMSIPHVGQYTAHAVRCFGHDSPYALV